MRRLSSVDRQVCQGVSLVAGTISLPAAHTFCSSIKKKSSVCQIQSVAAAELIWFLEEQNKTQTLKKQTQTLINIRRVRADAPASKESDRSLPLLKPAVPFSWSAAVCEFEAFPLLPSRSLKVFVTQYGGVWMVKHAWR